MVEFITGALVAWASVGLGQVLRTVQLRHRRPKEVKPTCACKHELAFHDPETGECHGRVEEESYDSRRGERTEWVTCTCRQYQGPQPLPEYFAPEIMP